MKKFIVYLLIIGIGAAGVYYGLTKYNEKKDEPQKQEIPKSEKEKTEVVPSRDGFVSEAIKLQTLAENKGNNVVCKCYNVKDLDKNTSLTGSILVYTIDDLFVSSMWLSNGYYILDGSDNAATGLLEESSEQASLYCGEADDSTQPSLCATNY